MSLTKVSPRSRVIGKNENQKGDRPINNNQTKNNLSNRSISSHDVDQLTLNVSVTLCPHCGQPMNTRNLAEKYFLEEGKNAAEGIRL